MTSENPIIVAAQAVALSAMSVGRNHGSLTAFFAAHGYPAPHPLASVFRSYDEIGATITRAEDVVTPIPVREQSGEIMDGIIRCERLIGAGVPWNKVRKRDVDLSTDDDVREFIAKCNLDRRHETESQRAMQAALLGLLEPRQGMRTDLGQNCRKLANVGSTYAKYARKVCERSSDELIEAVLAGEISVANAAITADELSKEHQATIYRNTRHGKQSFKTMAGNAILVERAKRLSQRCISLPNLAAPVVYLDAPLGAKRESPFNPRDTVSHYPVISDEEVENIVRRVLAPNAWVFSWTTVPHRSRAAKMLENLNCEVAAEFIWLKLPRERPGLGRLVRLKHEILLVGRHGNPPLPPTDRVPDSVVEADVQEHSKKPDVFRDIIIAMTPNLHPRLELFARGEAYPGFVAWGNEVTSTQQLEERITKAAA